jgi:hypothetical protein
MIGESWVNNCPGDAFTLNWFICGEVPPEPGLNGILYLSMGGTYIEIELEKVALLPQVSGFFDEAQEHEIYVTDSGSYIRLNLDV